jgi:mono/diheme cytochrome c family protein
MKKVASLIIAIAACAALTVACSKSGNSGSSNTAANTAATAAAAVATAASNAMPGAAKAMVAKTAAALPIPLAKLPSEPVAAGDAASGAKLFAANCESCHGAGGKNGTVGPSLAGAGLKAGQVAEMEEHPQAVDKDSGMPDLHLTKQQVADIAAYVASLK